MKRSTPRTFTGLAASGHKRAARNSGIFSNSGAGQKKDPLVKTSPCGPGITEPSSKANVKALRKAVRVPQKKTGMPRTGKSASAVQKYALK